MATEAVKVLGLWGSPFSRRVEMALKLKGVRYDFVEESMANKSDLLLRSNPVYKKIPVIIVDGKPLAESLVILEYVDEAYGGPSILPKDPYERARARFWAKFVDDKCLPSLWMSCWAEGEEQKNLMEQAKENLTILEGELKGKKFFGGDVIGLVDIAANFIALWVGVLQELAGITLINEEKHPIIWKWSQEFINDDSIKESWPDREKLYAFFHAQRMARLAAKSK